jgi:hypothetical protein
MPIPIQKGFAVKKLSFTLLFAGLLSLLTFGVALAAVGVILWTSSDVYSSDDRSFVVDVTSLPTANCVMKVGAFDVDNPTNYPPPEDDEVFLNGNYVMTLVGQDEQDSTTEANFPCNWLQQGKNDLAVKVIDKDWLVTLRYISISGESLAGSISEVVAPVGETRWEMVRILNADGSPYKPVPKTDLLIFSIGDASWVDGKSVNDAVRSHQLVFDPGVILLEDGTRGPGVGTAGFPGPKDGGYFSMAISSPGKPLQYLGTAYLPPAGAARELHCHEFKLGTLGAHTCPTSK